MNQIFESHAHYEDSAFDSDREALIASLARFGIEKVVNVGSDAATCRKTVELIEKYDFFYGALGIHPSEVSGASGEDLEWIRQEAKRNPKVCAVGEIGLDYHRLPSRDEKMFAVYGSDEAMKKEQRDYFVRQLAIAKEVRKPVVIHSRDAAEDTYTVMKSENAQDVGGVIHCFSYSPEEARKYLEMGFYIGLGGVVTFKNAVKAKEVCKYVPLERILLETDCPYMAPEPHRGERNSSLFLPDIARVISQIREIPYDEVVAVTNANAKRMYGI